jgi:cation:H+ antiporter
MLLQVLVLLVGFALLIKGADWFVDGAAGLARRLKIPQLVIGLTIVAMGTSMPEAAVSVTAAMDSTPGIAIGNVVGSNILNILLILGVTACMTTLNLRASTLWIEIPFLIAVTALLLVFGVTGSAITFWEGIIFLALFLGYLAVLAKREKEKEESVQEIPLWKSLVFMILGGVMVVKGSDLAVDSASQLAAFFGISQRFIGLTIVALGTSLPELVTSVVAARKGNAAIGNIVGSNIFNILFILGTASVICEIPFDSRFLVDTGIAIASAALLLAGSVKRRQLGKACGITMLGCYGVYFLYLCFC